MSVSTINGDIPLPEGRAVGGTEYSWCNAVRIGTGISVVAFLSSTFRDRDALQSSIRTLQKIHPILSCRLRFDPSRNTFFLAPSHPYVSLQYFDASATAELIPSDATVSESFHLLLEHELNRNEWDTDATDLMFASLYSIREHHLAVMLRAHTAVCDRSSAGTILRELMRLSGSGVNEEEISAERKLNLGIEQLIPFESARKPFWTRGLDVLGYSLNSFRFANLGFIDTASKRSSRFVRLRLPQDQTRNLLAVCRRSEVDLWAALAAAGVIAARSTKEIAKEQKEKYSVITLVNCREHLRPAVAAKDAGFYHSAIMRSHDVRGGDKVWEVARRMQASFTEAKKEKKHLTDIGDLNFLMNSAIERPSLTAGGAMRTALITVFEESVVEEREGEGVEDYMGCSSVHGIGPSIAVFDTVRRGSLDCLCVYPSPLHSRHQMENLIGKMKRLLLESSATL